RTIATGGAGHLALMPAGNVGIGTTSPFAKLSVEGDLALTGTIRTGSTTVLMMGAQPLLFASTSHSYALGVSALAGGAHTRGNIAIGHEALLRTGGLTVGGEESFGDVILDGAE